MYKKFTPSKRLYQERANKLRKYGYKITYSSARKSLSTAAHKAAVSAYWFGIKGRAGLYYYATDTEKNRVEFKRFKSISDRKKWRTHLSKEQITPSGFFVQRPKGIAKGRWRMVLRRDGSVEITTSDKTKIRDVVLRLDASALAIDSKSEFERILKGKKIPKQYILTVNGFDASKGASQGIFDLETFNRYIETDLIPRLDEAGFDYEKYGDEIFGLRLVYSGKGEKKVGDEGKSFDFKNGSIFDKNSKKVYGKRKFEERKKYTTKKGKRKGT